ANPVEVGFLDTPGSATGVSLAGSLAYVADASGGVSVIDIRDAAAPKLVASYDTPGSAQGVTVADGKIYLADNEAGLRVLELQQPTSVSATDVAVSLMVTPVNDAPTLAGGSVSLTGTDEDTASAATPVSALLSELARGDLDAGAVSGIAVTAATGNGTWEFSIDGTTWTGFGAVSADSALLLTDTTQIRYVPDGIDGETAGL